MTIDVTTNARGFDAATPVPSEYGGYVRASESSNAEYAGIWLWTTAPEKLANRQIALGGGRAEPEPYIEVPANLTAENAWLLARQVLRLVANHYQGDARPESYAGDALAAVDAALDAADWTQGYPAPTAADLLECLHRAGYAVVRVGPGETEEAAG